MPDGMSEDPTRAGAAPGGPGSAPMAPPAGTPAMSDQKASGEIEQAKANVQMAMQILEQALPQLGSDSDEGATVLKALSMMSKTFAGKKQQDLVPAELMQLLSGMPDQNKQQVMAEMGKGASQGGSPPPMPPI
jgi:hypothetical protein